MNYPGPEDVTVDTIVSGSGLADRSGPNAIMLPAPWEMMLMQVNGSRERFRPYWCCPRCLDVMPIPHSVQIQGAGVQSDCVLDRNIEGRDYLRMFPEDLDALRAAPGEVSITADPSIGCQVCDFHCYLEDGQYRVLSDFNGDSAREPERVYSKRIQHLHEYRPEAYDRLAELVESG